MNKLIALLALGALLALATPRVEAETSAIPDDVKAADMPTLAHDLEKKLALHPEDPDRWHLLGRTYEAMGETTKSVRAYRKAVEHSDRAAAHLITWAEGIMRFNGGEIDAEVRALLDEAAKKAPEDPRPVFYRGVALYKKGEAGAALELWARLLRDAPLDADWKDGMREHIREAAERAEIDPASLLDGKNK